MDEAWTATLMLIIFGWCCFFIQADRDYTVRQQAISNITYNYSQIAAKKGELSTEVYNEFVRKIYRYGEFSINVSAQRYKSDGTIEIIEGADLLDIDLRQNDFDIVNVGIIGTKKHFLSLVYELSPMGASNTEYRLMSLSSAYIE